MYLLRGHIEDIPVWLDDAVHGAAIAIYLLIGVFAILQLLRVEAILLTVLVFLGFNVAWLLLYSRLPKEGVG